MTEATKKSFSNIGNITTTDVRHLNPVSVLGSTYIIFENPEAAIAIMAQRAHKKTAVVKAEANA